MIRFPIYSVLASLLLSHTLVGEELAASRGQLGAELEMVPAPDLPNQFYLLQRSADKTLLLTPNEAFFPRRGLKLTGKGTVPDVANLNGGKSFSSIDGWASGKMAEWGCYFSKAGTVRVELAQRANSQFSIRMGDSEFIPLSNGKATLTVASPGRHSLLVRCDQSHKNSSVFFLRLSGDAVENGGVVRKRWRPAAAHTKFTSSKSEERVRLWIMEMDAVPGDLGFYCPITTPFGYYGPTWKADGTANTGFNFSLWSFGRGAKEPPLEQLSHLLAIGNPDAKFGGFDHEGTGVKIRGWEPLQGRSGQRQAIALRVEPGDRYDTYFSYFFANDEQRWRLFGSGRKWNKGKPLSSLWVGSFVEVPGPPPVQRTGPYERTMRYRGWIIDEKGALLPLDQMRNGNINKETGLTHTDRGISEDDWFYLRTGGWTFRKPPAGGRPISLPNTPVEDAPFLEPEKLAALQSVPSSIEAGQLERRNGKAAVTFEIQNRSTAKEAILYYGPEEGLTFEDRWANHVLIPEIREGENQFVFDDPDPSKDLRVRLYLRNKEGQFWSTSTLAAKPLQ